MTNERLKLNQDKTHVIWLGTRQQLNKAMVQTLANAIVQFSDFVNNLAFGMTASHIAAPLLLSTSTAKQSLTTEAMKTLYTRLV